MRASNIEANEITESDKVGVGQFPRNKPGYDIDKGGINDAKKEKNEVSRVIIDSVSGDDLVTILRQKALENIKSFRRGLERSQAAAKSAVIQKDKHDGAVEALSPVMPELGQIKSSKSNLTRMPREDYAHFLQHEKIPNGGICDSESSSARNNVHPPDQVAILGREKVSTVSSSSKNKTRLITSASRQALSNATTTLEETLDSPEANQAKLASETSLGKSATLKEAPTPLEANQAKLRSRSNVVKNTPYGAHTVTSPIVNGNDASVSIPAEPSACIASSVGDITLDKSLDEGKEGSQLEQKTTSVTRGAEMLQVNV